MFDADNPTDATQTDAPTPAVATAPPAAAPAAQAEPAYVLPESFDIELELKSIPVRIKCKDGTTRQCLLREMTGTERDAYFNTQSKRNPTGKITDFTGIEAMLVSRCLVDTSNGQLLPETEVNNIPAVALSKLHKAALVMNDMEAKKSKDAAKNA